MGSATHTAFFYRGDTDYLDGIGGFLEEGVRDGDPIVIAVPHARAELLADHLGRAAARLEFLDMEKLGRNPARIIPDILGLLGRHRGRTVHFIGESVWPGRTQEEIRETVRHEALINVAWPEATIRVLCPYDADGLAPEVLRDAESTHPWVRRGHTAARSALYGGSAFPAGSDLPLPDPPADAARMTFTVSDLAAVRTLVAGVARGAGLDPDRIDDFIIAVNEVATNAIKYGDDGGRLVAWATGTEAICQLEDPGHITDRLAGRHAPVAGTGGGIGLWMVNQLCDLVQTRTTREGTTIRLHAAL